MSNLKCHLDRITHNELFVSSLGDPFWDWAVTGTFYTAVHYVEAYFSKKTPPVHSSNHPDRDDKIKRDAALGILWSDYRSLKDQSRYARYEPHIPFSATDLKKAQEYLDTIKRAIAPLL